MTGKCQFEFLNGIDVVTENPSLIENLGNIAIVCNQSCCNNDFQPTVDLISDLSKKLTSTTVKLVCGLQHGYHLCEQDNMIETQDSIYQTLSGDEYPLISLYSSKGRKPLKEQFSNIDTFIIDIFDVGCRVYTFISSMKKIIKYANQNGQSVIVLDRVNPLLLAQKQDNNKSKENKENKEKTVDWMYIEGNVLSDQSLTSFSGQYSIPLRFGMTAGELASWYIKQSDFNLDFKVIKVKNYARDNQDFGKVMNYFSKFFTLPSPNLPTHMTSLVYNSTVFLEGTNLSEGRGTTKPFEIIGAPFLNPEAIINKISSHQKQQSLKNEMQYYNSLCGVKLFRFDFRPTFSKFKNQICKGIYLKITDPKTLNNFALGMYLIYYIIKHCPKFEFLGKGSGYEYNLGAYPFSCIVGSKKWKGFFDKVAENTQKDYIPELDQLLLEAQNESNIFASKVQNFFLY
ncbi:hypothetical protein M0813_05482 [Anaeramoeba flamelloides]|uniref:DUF1343 domain-containing protein n=1 Tax=Anaeramoeba flamelloides TaxID=1746091 RepID=A0AAV7ZL96_9EUKA|nr:hypothetical protein M0812_13609 [Anaeramoeba flamelloides]KAJ6231751.1 hypothetical protein M0813_05482 [Anaeramoeba flamelloides]